MGFKVRFLPDDKVVEVDEGTPLMEAAERVGVYLNSLCGGKGVCGKCKVKILKGDVKPDKHSLSVLSSEEIKNGFLLACQLKVTCDLEVEIPPESRLEDEQILIEGRRRIVEETVFSYSDPEWVSVKKIAYDPASFIDPLTRKVYIELPEPTIDDNISDRSRLERELRKKFKKDQSFDIELSCLRELPFTLRENNFKVTTTLCFCEESWKIIGVEGGDTSNDCYGVAVDVGTTTVAAQLVHLRTGKVLGVRGSHNKQARYGEDVLSRIVFACDVGGTEKLEILQKAVADNINTLIDKLCSEKGVSRNDITSIVAAGNTTMSHILLGLPPCFIRLDPYTPIADLYPMVAAKEIGVEINPNGVLYTVPCVASYLGGDIVAGVLACGIPDRPEISCLIDIGTNGEIVIGNNDWMVSCSASAGPAFEGVGMSCGMKATKGAIQKVEIEGDEVRYKTIGDAKPRGVCGSGLVELLYELAKNGIVDIDGKIRKGSSKRVIELNGKLAYVVAYPEETEDGRRIVLEQTDIEHLMRSKGAIFAALKTLVDYVGFSFDDIEKIYVAGGFGNYLNLEKAIGIGLLPDVPKERIEFVGNTSLMGARMILLSIHALERAVEISQTITNIELSVYDPFVREYMAALYLPHIDAKKLFPSVKYWQV